MRMPSVRSWNLVLPSLVSFSSTVALLYLGSRYEHIFPDAPIFFLPSLASLLLRQRISPNEESREFPSSSHRRLAQGQIKAPPGSRLRVFAEFCFSRRTYERVLEPILRDLFDEYCEALNDHRPWKARWVQTLGYWSFWSAVLAQMPISMVKMVYKIWQTTR
jgi:hypothetical protein